MNKNFRCVLLPSGMLDESRWKNEEERKEIEEFESYVFSKWEKWKPFSYYVRHATIEQVRLYKKLKVGSEVIIDGNVYPISSIANGTHFHVKGRPGQWNILCSGFDLLVDGKPEHF